MVSKTKSETITKVAVRTDSRHGTSLRRIPRHNDSKKEAENSRARSVPNRRKTLVKKRLLHRNDQTRMKRGVKHKKKWRSKRMVGKSSFTTERRPKLQSRVVSVTSYASPSSSKVKRPRPATALPPAPNRSVKLERNSNFFLTSTGLTQIKVRRPKSVSNVKKYTSSSALQRPRSCPEKRSSGENFWQRTLKKRESKIPCFKIRKDQQEVFRPDSLCLSTQSSLLLALQISPIAIEQKVTSSPIVDLNAMEQTQEWTTKPKSSDNTTKSPLYENKPRPLTVGKKSKTVDSRVPLRSPEKKDKASNDWLENLNRKDLLRLLCECGVREVEHNGRIYRIRTSRGRNGPSYKVLQEWAVSWWKRTNEEARLAREDWLKILKEKALDPCLSSREYLQIQQKIRDYNVDFPEKHSAIINPPKWVLCPAKKDL